MSSPSVVQSPVMPVQRQGQIKSAQSSPRVQAVVGSVNPSPSQVKQQTLTPSVVQVKQQTLTPSVPSPQQQQRKRKQIQKMKTLPHKPLVPATVYILSFLFGLVLFVFGFLFYYVFVRKTVSIQVTKVYKTDGTLTSFDYYYVDNSRKTGTIELPGYRKRDANWKLNFLSNFQNANNPITLYVNKGGKLFFRPRIRTAYLFCWIVGSLLLLGSLGIFDK